jgi:hypothetical protein
MPNIVIGASGECPVVWYMVVLPDNIRQKRKEHGMSH